MLLITKASKTPVVQRVYGVCGNLRSSLQRIGAHALRWCKRKAIDYSGVHAMIHHARSLGPFWQISWSRSSSMLCTLEDRLTAVSNEALTPSTPEYEASNYLLFFCSLSTINDGRGSWMLGNQVLSIAGGCCSLLHWVESFPSTEVSP